MNDPRLAGRCWSTDPITKPWKSPYAGYGNNPVSFIDPLGLTPGEGANNGQYTTPEVVVTAEGPKTSPAQLLVLPLLWIW